MMLGASIIAHGRNLLNGVQNIIHLPELFKHWNALLENDERFGLHFFPESISEQISTLVCVCVCLHVGMCVKKFCVQKRAWDPPEPVFQAVSCSMSIGKQTQILCKSWSIAPAALLTPDYKEIWTGFYGMYGYLQSDWLSRSIAWKVYPSVKKWALGRAWWHNSFNLRTQKAGRSLGVQGQPGLHSEALPHKRNKQETSLVLVTGFKPIKLKNMYL